MENIPKIVRERLRVATVAVDHPDADMLTAFAERALPEAERATVLGHLARCGECREIVALALPPLEAAAMPVALSRTRRFTWPALRWGFAVAGVAVIASLAVVQLQRRGQSSSLMMAYKAAQPAANEARNQTLPAIPQSEAAGNKKLAAALVAGKSADTGKFPARDGGSPAASVVNSPQVAGGAGFSRGVLSHGPRLANQANQFQQQNANAFAGANVAMPVPPLPTAKQQSSAQLVANAPVPAAPQIQPSSAPVNTHAQNFDLKTEAIAEQPSNYGHGEEKVGRAKEPPDTVVHIEPEKVLAGPVRSDAMANSLPNTRWGITSAGGLQRSLDQGNSWQDVNVKTTPAPAAANFEVMARSSRAKAKDSAKADTIENGAMVFRAVAANGMEVWAGGSAGQLYHSTDSGNHWSKVVPSAGGAVLTGDVVKLDFADAQHGRVSTSTSEDWITSDDGLDLAKAIELKSEHQRSPPIDHPAFRYPCKHLLICPGSGLPK